MGMQAHTCYHHHQFMKPLALPLPSSSSSSISVRSNCYSDFNGGKREIDQKKAFGVLVERCTGFCCSVDLRVRRRKKEIGIVASSSTNVADGWKPQKGSKAPLLSDVVWPSAGAFAAMAILGKMDQMLATKGLSMTIAPVGAVCAVLFATSSAPAARKYNMFMAQIGCAAIGVLALSIFGPGWLARSTGLAAAIAFMICTHSIHPPAASLVLLFIDGAKCHHLNFWYALFPGATGCILLSLIQEVVCYLKDNFKF
ncbi:uncharacterized protein LOC132286775 isoform X1 [Cornus florida]|uniref:uncharacterized protein LOC132286775 isoform X1 n=1 Tax=Cornus florida TaxID=4283 RepID=UPI0028993DDE|nr:uncharacterized protein LOC132286775 isoform X1 [Cornus florida]